MAIAVEDPLIARMAIGRPLPIHESSRRLRLTPTAAGAGVAVLADVSRRRWWPLDSAVADGRLREMFEASAADLGNRRGAGQQLAAALVHAVAGRVVTLLTLEGRAWDAGPGNLWLHNDSEGPSTGPGWWTRRCGCCPMTRSPMTSSGCPARRRWPPGPRTAATFRWRRCSPNLCDLTAGALSTAAMWRMVGTCVVVTATGIPLRTGAGELICMRRGQAVLDALTTFGLPVRAPPAPAGNRIPGPRRRAEGCSDSWVLPRTDPASRTRVRPCRHRCVQPEQSLTDKIAFDAPFDNQIGLVFTELTPTAPRRTSRSSRSCCSRWASSTGACTARSSSRWPARRPTSALGQRRRQRGRRQQQHRLPARHRLRKVFAVSEPVHRGRRQQLWLVTIRDEQDRVVARGQVRLQNLETDPPQ